MHTGALVALACMRCLCGWRVLLHSLCCMNVQEGLITTHDDHAHWPLQQHVRRQALAADLNAQCWRAKAVGLNSPSLHYMVISKISGPNVGPKWKGSRYEDAHKKDPQAIETAIYVVLLIISFTPALHQPKENLKPLEWNFNSLSFNFL